MQKLPLQPPYYDMAPSESTPFTDKLVSSDTMRGFKWASPWRGHPLQLPSGSGHFWWKGKVSVLKCLEEFENSFKTEMQCCGASRISLKSLEHSCIPVCLSGVKRGAFLTTWPVNPLVAFLKLLISSFTSAPHTYYLNLGWPISSLCLWTISCSDLSTQSHSALHLTSPPIPVIYGNCLCVCMATMCR